MGKTEDMSKNKKAEPETPPPSESSATGEVSEQSAKEIQVHYRPAPSPPPPDQKIHPRQIIPPVPEGEEVPDDTPSPPVEIE
jgi:hypothetical protein